ncbi:hypothetical protein PHYSODRAFT_494645 [Phytophthora sojae]|uniref:Uncharacterized protein n=1 Tax=Phytophthora sojae (strain P6497) TaxID=1094619 RepID=G4Z6I5_PHYSP|nr:hypothetical protein PHYSODRAFT_494645 [Phytophthora sojae]EGZ19555.1 hypothetical protein PHYSODRAFT_494645 [Phytophthora sojae]|eukprot:XP_009522272.1 hypothetical protein PHYSODRAFT_494645 [Phytophthora sojae]
MIPVHAVFTVDFFDALYLATFMQSLSMSTLVAIVIVDIMQNAVELQELHQRTLRIIARTQRVVGPTTNTAYNGNLLEAVRWLCSSPGVLHKQIRAGIRVRSCIEHQVSPESNSLLTILENARQTGSIAKLFDHLPSINRVPSQSASIRPTPGELVLARGRYPSNSNSVQPSPPLIVSRNNSPPADLPDRRASIYSSRRRSVVDSSVVLKDALEVLFTSECLVLTEYVEVIIPLLYGAFILTMVHQSSAQYHTEMHGVTLENVNGMVLRMFLYALLELGSFVVLGQITKRNCGINALYQLAFVLEKQMAFIQVTLLMGVLMTLTFRVVHFGKSVNNARKTQRQTNHVL